MNKLKSAQIEVILTGLCQGILRRLPDIKREEALGTRLAHWLISIIVDASKGLDDFKL